MAIPLDISASEIFARVSRKEHLSTPNPYALEEMDIGYYTRLRQQQGAKKFKRNALGLCRLDCIKSKDQLVGLLTSLGAASSASEALEVIPLIVEVPVIYSSNKAFRIEELLDVSTGIGRYRISVEKLGPSMLYSSRRF